jgi:hypothetical protein
MKVSMSWPERLALPVEELVGGMVPGLPVSHGIKLRQTTGRSTVDPEFDSLPVLRFVINALALAAAGLYRMPACRLAQPTSQIGIRLALGAKRKRVFPKMLFDQLRPALAGLVPGLAGSPAALRLIESMLHETDLIDPAVFTAVLTTLLACAVPAWRASRLEPVQALRTE